MEIYFSHSCVNIIKVPCLPIHHHHPHGICCVRGVGSQHNFCVGSPRRCVPEGVCRLSMCVCVCGVIKMHFLWYEKHERAALVIINSTLLYGIMCWIFATFAHGINISVVHNIYIFFYHMYVYIMNIIRMQITACCCGNIWKLLAECARARANIVLY